MVHIVLMYEYQKRCLHWTVQVPYRAIVNPLICCCQYKSNLPTAVQTLLGGSPHRGRIAAPTVPYDLPLVRLMYEYSWYEVPYWYEYLLPACMHAGRQAGRQASRTNLVRIPFESRTNPERTPTDNEGSRIYM